MDPRVVLSLLLLVLAVVGVFIRIPFVSDYAFWVAIAAYVILHWMNFRGAHLPGILSLILLGLAVVGVLANIPFVCDYAFWFAVAAYVIRDWFFNELIWVGLLSLLVVMLAVAAVFCEIPFVSNYAFWFVIAAFMIRLMVVIPDNEPHRIGVPGE